MSLRDWLTNGWLREHRPSKEEIRDLLGVADRDLADCQTPGLSPDWRLSIAYNAALQAATTALAASGFRPSREAHHYRTIQSLAHTIGAEPGVVAQLDRFRKKRNIGGYERAGAVSEQEAGEMLALAGKLRRDVEAWMKTTYPGLL